MCSQVCPSQFNPHHEEIALTMIQRKGHGTAKGFGAQLAGQIRRAKKGKRFGERISYDILMFPPVSNAPEEHFPPIGQPDRRGTNFAKKPATCRPTRPPPGEEGKPSPDRELPKKFWFLLKRAAHSPLPKGEGQGEGKKM